ncbi:LegC family aminotransferase (plasmid) [Azospirillum sp. HJ39]|uniref:LegC family aminotransferase n=1 Tax=Azospirillum sp. HJ39 TaxID=3159496 RepID=UPI0035566E51
MSRVPECSGFDVAEFVRRVQHPLTTARPLPLHEPRFSGREWEYVRDCLESGWVSSVGSYVDRFEGMIAERLGASHAVATVNGTAALHVALLLAGVETGDEVLVPALTFVATANAVRYCNATPHLVDSALDTLGIDPDRLEDYLRRIASVGPDGCVNRLTSRRIRAVVPMHVFGHPVSMDRLMEVASRWRLTVVEDAAEAMGSLYRGSPVGGLGHVGIVSFNGNKIVTCGGGGAVVTHDAELARAARHLTTTAKLPHPWRYRHDLTGFNYRLPNLNAALGCAQMEQLDGFIAAKRRLTESYAESLDDLPGVRLVTEPAGCRSIYWLNAVLVPDQDARDAVLAATHRAGLLTRPAWDPLHLLPMYADCPRDDLPIAEELFARIVCLPSGVAAPGS